MPQRKPCRTTLEPLFSATTHYTARKTKLHAHTYTITNTHMHNYKHTHAQLQTHTYTNTNTHTHNHTHTYTQLHTHTYTTTNTHIYTITHTHIHNYTHDDFFHCFSTWMLFYSQENFAQHVWVFLFLFSNKALSAEPKNVQSDTLLVYIEMSVSS